MKNEHSISESLVTYIKYNKIATMDELKNILKTPSRMTVFRKLKRLDYISSCSHSGKYYSLKGIARYDKFGIWACRSVLFSKHGTLKKSLEAILNSSPQGYTSSELNKILKLKIDDTLLELVKNGTVIRKKLTGVYVYYSIASKQNKKQELMRINRINYPVVEMNPQISMDELKATLIIFYSTLDEKQRRLYAGFESLKIGYGGDKKIAELLNIDKKTVARGRKELLSGKVNLDTIRESGGGRQQIKKKFQT